MRATTIQNVALTSMCGLGFTACTFLTYGWLWTGVVHLLCSFSCLALAAWHVAAAKEECDAEETV